MPAWRDDWLFEKDVADALSLHSRSAWAIVGWGDLPSERDDSAPGRPYRVRRADVDRFIERSRVKPRQLSHLQPPRIPSSREADT
jgi:hypothetical protein